MQPLSLPCNGACGQSVAIDPSWGHRARQFGVYCDACQQRVDAAAEQERLAAEREHIMRHRRAKFQALCPPCYCDTVLERLPCREKSAQALAWEYGPTGLVLFGTPRSGKTRTASILVEREMCVGKSAACLAPGQFAQNLEQRGWKPHAYIKKLSVVDLLLCDDLGKWNMLPSVERHFFAVLNARAGRLPTIFTCNETGKQITVRFLLGKAMEARMREFCSIVWFRTSDLT